MRSFWTLDYDDLLDQVLDDEVAAGDLVSALLEADASEVEAGGRKLYGLLRAKIRQLLKTSSAASILTEWNNSCVRTEAWMRQKGKWEFAQKMMVLVELLEDEATLQVQQPAEVMLRHTHVREILDLVITEGGEVARVRVLKKLKLGQPNLTRLLNLLEASRLIGRKRIGKQKRIYLTERGRKLALDQRKRKPSHTGAKMVPIWAKDLRVEIPRLVLTADAPTGAIDAQLLFAAKTGLGKPLGIDIAPIDAPSKSDHTALKSHLHFGGRISLNMPKRHSKSAMDVCITHAVHVPLVIDTGPAADWTRQKAVRVLKQLRSHYHSDADITIVANERDAKILLGTERPSVRGVQVKYFRGPEVSRYFTATRSAPERERGIEIFLCPEPRTADIFRSSWCDDFVVMARPDNGPKLPTAPRLKARRSCLATLEVDIDPANWMQSNRELDAVSRFYRLGDLLARQMPQRVDDYLRYLHELAHSRGVLGESVAASLASTSEDDLREVLFNSYQWWRLGGADEKEALAENLFSKLVSDATNGAGASASSVAAVKQAIFVRAHEETRVGEMWRKHESIMARAKDYGLQHEFEGWFNENAREAADNGLWFGVNAAMDEANKRMFGSDSTAVVD